MKAKIKKTADARAREENDEKAVEKRKMNTRFLLYKKKSDLQTKAWNFREEVPVF